MGNALEGLDPWPQLDLQGPGAARLAQDLDIGLGDRVGIERAVRAVQRIGMSRTAHAAARVERAKEYIEAAVALAASDSRILFRHLLPNCLPPLLVLAAVLFAIGVVGAVMEGRVVGEIERSRDPAFGEGDYVWVVLAGSSTAPFPATAS